MCIYMCVEVVLINILALHLAPQTEISGSALEQRRERQEREEIKNYLQIIKKYYLNEMVKKNISFNIYDIIKWYVICYKIGF